MKRKRSLSVAISFASLMSFISGAEAGFLEDIFGPDPAPQAAAPSKSRARSSGRRFSTSAPTEHVRSEIHYMPERHEERRRAWAPEEHRGRPLKVAHDDANQSSAGSKTVQTALCEPEGPEMADAPASAASKLLVDKTLRAGDVLVTDKGVHVLRGQKACPHDATNFVPVSIAGLSKSRRTVLLAIEDAMHRPSGYQIAADSKH